MSYIGGCAFNDCTNLTDVYMEGNVPTIVDSTTFDFTSSSLKVWVNNNSYIIYLLSSDWQYLLPKLRIIA